MKGIQPPQNLENHVFWSDCAAVIPGSKTLKRPIPMIQTSNTVIQNYHRHTLLEALCWREMASEQTKVVFSFFFFFFSKILMFLSACFKKMAWSVKSQHENDLTIVDCSTRVSSGEITFFFFFYPPNSCSNSQFLCLTWVSYFQSRGQSTWLSHAAKTFGTA